MTIMLDDKNIIREFNLEGFRFFIEHMESSGRRNYDYDLGEYSPHSLSFDLGKEYFELNMTCFISQETYDAFIKKISHLNNLCIPLLFSTHRRYYYLPQSLFVDMREIQKLSNHLIDGKIFHKIRMKLVESILTNEEKKCPFCQKYGMIDHDKEINGFLINKCVLCDAIWYDDTTLDNDKNKK